MRKRGAAARMALCGVLAALAVALMFLGGTVPFASIACPVLASLVLIPVYCECGWKWGLLWYAAVAALAALLAPEKEAAVLFVFFGYYPMLRKLIGRLRVRAAAWVVKLVYVNAAVFAAYGLMLYVFHLTAGKIAYQRHNPDHDQDRKQENRKDHLFIFKYSCKLFLINRSHPMLPPLRF